jgi:hypothetical protein
MRNSPLQLVLFIVSIFFLEPNLVYSQIPGIELQKCFGGTGSDAASTIVSTNDGGYVFAGSTMSQDGDVSGRQGSIDAWIVKLDSSLNIQWQKCYGGTEGLMKYSVIQTLDGGYAFDCATGPYDSLSGFHAGKGDDFLMVKLNSAGLFQWKKCLGGSKNDQGTSIRQTNDRGYILAGYTASNDGDVSGHHGGTGSDAWVVKLDSTGNVQWQKCLGGKGDDVAYSVILTSDGGYAIAGYTWSNDGDVIGNHGQMDAWIVRLDSVGNIKWQRSLGGANQEWFKSIMQDSDGGFVCAGYTGSLDGDVVGLHPGGYYDAWIVKLDSLGNLLWQNCLGGSKGEELTDVIRSMDGGYVTSGFTFSDDEGFFTHGDWDAWIVKIDSKGEFQWQKCLGGTGADQAFAVIQSSKNEYIVAGSTNSKDGDVFGQHGGVPFYGPPCSDAWIVKLGSKLSVETPHSPTELLPVIAVYPNPASSYVTISFNLPFSSPVKINIFDLLGTRVNGMHQIQMESGYHEIPLELATLPNGTYYLRTEACGKTGTKVIQVIK